MRTKPRCLKNKDNLKFRDSNLEKTDNFSIGSNSENSSPIRTSYPITDKFNGSFCSVNTADLSANDPAREYKDYRNQVKNYINIFKDHIYDKEHPINIVNKYFVKLFSEYLKEQIEEIKQNKKQKSDEEYNSSLTILIDEMIKCLQKFIIKLQTALRLMYAKTLNYQCFIEEKDEFINLVTSLVFKEGRIYEILYDLVKISLKEQIKILEDKLLDMKHIKPEDLGIHDKFCLNSKTYLFQKEMLNNKLLSRNNEKNKVINHDENHDENSLHNINVENTLER
jgi:hypothetical protein